VPASSKKTSAEALALRITVVDPPPNISWALQLGCARQRVWAKNGT